MSHYINYYRRTLLAHAMGLKLVLGGTGLGKTSSLAALLRSGDFPPDTKFIYVANRIQLLDEMAAQVSDLNLHVHQKRDADQLVEVLAQGLVASLLDYPATPALLADHNQRNPLSATTLERLRGRANRFQQLQGMGLDSFFDLAELARELLRPLKSLLALARQLVAATPAEGQRTTQQEARALAGLPLWPALFPYLHFQEYPACRLLLLTVQKAFHGVFDGERTQRLGQWDAPATGRYVFVFDEFDFLENDLLAMLADDREVRDPFGLVQTFYRRINEQKLVHSGYLAREPRWQPIRDRLERICRRIETLRDEHGIDFPAITHFVSTDDQLKGKAIFQSNYSLVKRPVYLHAAPSRRNTFELTTDRKGRKAFVLLDVVNRTVKDIIRLFGWLKTEHEDVYPELLRQCFGGTDYRAEVQRTRPVGHPPEYCETNYGNLLVNGFGLYEIEEGRSRLTDPDEVAISYRSLHTSPEALLRDMGRQHLVFGLSATAHIRRVLRNFDWAGLARPADPTQSFQPLENTPDDQEDIARANAQKAAVRANTLTLHQALPLEMSVAFGPQLAAIAHNLDNFDEAGPHGHRLRRARHFFAVLARLAGLHAAGELPAHQTHLLFLASVRQVAQLLQKGGDEDGWYGAMPLPGAAGPLQLYDVWFRDEATDERLACYVALYDARFGQALRADPTLDRQYNELFWQGRPVLVVTTYPSAGNGVNLQYYLSELAHAAQDTTQKRDFRYLHLLDAPYYYFSGTDQLETADQEPAAIKRDVYGIMKLLYAKLISEEQAVGQLGHVRHLNRFNRTYLALNDGVLNQVSVVVQALGRIERVWQPMPDQELWLDDAVYAVLEKFATRPELAADCRNYLRYASANMQTLLAHIARQAPAERQALDDELLDLHRPNEAARQHIRQLVLDIEQFKHTGQPADTRTRWQQLREEVLKHDLRGPQLQAVRGTFQTDYARDGQLWLNAENQVAPPQVRSAEFEPWDLNALYRPLTRFLDSFLAHHFRRQGFELAFHDGGTYLLPYVYQSILAGAIGEEAVLAVLHHAGIAASGDGVPDAVFEVADLRVHNRPIFIDCKNYGVRTQRQFALLPDDPLYHPKLNEPHFVEGMVRKWQRLHDALPPGQTEPCRLLIMNLLVDDSAALRYYDEQFRPVADWAAARLVVLTGVLLPQPPSAQNLLTPACQALLQSIKFHH
ncbi:hypothetical protein FNT36_10580 [Hymenobacter setariae]|uniref:Uncharacterized protein n=1 Tax=Hymenobacter setariae TaxID=2594794 RepID=A0A558BZB2_9BACT|nr:hypothetical protein [Hymenobacter setariae]TVT41858.1 hypothetical protein FNT36_10580 [Hymenobacter setariae]